MDLLLYSKQCQKVSGQKLDFGHLEPEEMFLEGFHGFWQKVAEPEKVSAESEVKFLAAQKLNFGHWSLKKCFWRLRISVSGDLEPEEMFLADIWPAGLSAVEPKKVTYCGV